MSVTLYLCRVCCIDLPADDFQPSHQRLWREKGWRPTCRACIRSAKRGGDQRARSTCERCNHPLPKNKSRWCSDACAHHYERMVCPLIPATTWSPKYIMSREIETRVGTPFGFVVDHAGRRRYLKHPKWCEHCDKMFRVHAPSVVRRFCSNECREAARCKPNDIGPIHGPHVEDIGPPHDVPQPHTLECLWCNLTFYSATRKKYCSTACSDYSIPGRRSLSVDIAFGACRRCGDNYCREARHDNGFCSSACSTKASRSRRKAMRRNHRKSGENFTLREIAERDNWRCHLCGKGVPDQEYAARDDDPTLDHLVPVSAGGEHTRANVALSHNRCNWERGDTPIEFQQRLIA